MASNRVKVGALVLSASTLVGIAVNEKYRGDAYLPTAHDVPTIGYGETQGVKLGDKTTPDRALVQLLASAQAHADGIKQCIAAPLYQGEFDVYADLAYNIGVHAFCTSTLVKKLNAQDYVGACAEILRWDRQAGRQLPGLTKRRQQEYQQCRAASAAPTNTP